MLAPAPGPLPFEVTGADKVRRERGSVASALVAFFAVLFFFAAAAGGFALSRYVGGEPIMPPDRQTTTSTSTEPPAEDDAGALETRKGNAASTTPAQGGGFQVPVPKDWVEFTEEVSGDELPNSTRFYYVSPDGTQLLTVERFVDFYPDNGIDEYALVIESRGPEVATEKVEQVTIPGIETSGRPAEEARQLTYRTITSAGELAPGDPNAQDLYQSTIARALPYARDLWVVSMTVLIEQEGPSRELFADIVEGFKVTG